MNERNGRGNGHASNGNGVAYTSGAIGAALGYAGVEQIDDRAGRYCSTERQRLEAANRPKIAAAKQDLVGVESDLHKLRQEESKLPPEGDIRKRRRKALYLFAFFLVLCVGGFVSALFSLEPLMADWKRYFLSVAIAGILPFAVHYLINENRSERLLHWLAVSDLVFAGIAIGSLTLIRSQVLAEEMKQANTAIVIDGDAPVTMPTPSTFFERTAGLMTIFSVFTTLAMELAAGLALHAACRLWEEMPANADQVRQRCAELEQRRINLVQQIEAWEQEPEEFVNRFWRDYHEAQLRGIKGNRFTKMFGAALVFLTLWGGASRAYAAEPLNLVVAVDLTASVSGAAGFDQKTELQRNVASVGQILASVPPGAQVTVVGITDRSFAQPYVLLSARLDGNPGYFQERINGARQQLVAAWQKRSQAFVVNFSQTDLLGTLVMASQVFEPRDGHHNVLVILSDMRHETRSLNLARLPAIRVQPTLERVARESLIGDLKGIDVYVLGVDSAGKSVGYWNSLRDFWLAYFTKAGAKVCAYSMLRNIPQF